MSSCKMNLRSIHKLLTKCCKNKIGIKEHKSNVYTLAEELTYPKHVRITDFRSDTLSKPTPAMREAIYNANVGDDVYGEDPTTNELEKKGAAMLGKEAALFTASGTMANLLALMAHSDSRGCEIIVGDESHILLWEQAGAAQLAGIQLRSVINRKDGTFDINDMLKKVRNNSAYSFLPKTSLICVENTHNNYGGQVLPLSWIRELGEAVKPLGIPLHMDGARFFNSVVKTGVPPAEIVRDFDSINICLSKGLGAPIGSLLVGSHSLIKRARHLRKAVGGGMRQLGHMAAAGIYALDNMVDRLSQDHNNTRAIAKGIHNTGSKIISVDLDSLQTNILLINVDTNVVKVEDFCRRLTLVTDEELKEETPVVVKILPWTRGVARLVVCCNNTNEDVEAAIRKFQRVIREYESGTFMS